jgi:DNA polymerase-3 subunit alpha
VGDKVAKLMPPLVMGRDTPLKYCFEQNPKYADGYKAASELRAMYEADPDVKRVVDVAKGLEGLKRSDGIHAAAVVITKDPLTTTSPSSASRWQAATRQMPRSSPSSRCTAWKSSAC